MSGHRGCPSFLRRDGSWVVLEPPRMEYFSPEDNRSFNVEVALRDPSGPTAWFLGAKWAAKMALFKYRNPGTIVVDDSPETAAAGMEAMMRGMLDETRRIGAKLVVLHLPSLPRGRLRAVPPALAAAVASKDIAFVDFAPVAEAYYAREAAGTLVLGPDDAHPNALPHRLIAETLAQAIRDLLA